MSSNFWSTIPSSIRIELERISQNRKFQKGEIVFSENEAFRGFAVIRSGKFKIYNLNLSGKEAILRVLEEGEMAAAPLIFSEHPVYPATLECLDAGSVYFFEAVQFRQFLKNHSEFQMQFTGLIMQFMHYLKNKTSSHMLLNLKERMLEYLKEQGAELNLISLPINKNQLALLLDATPESISRMFKSLEEEGILEVKGKKYRLKQSEMTA
ncbi:MAG TPA: Crp/Fnr family transcriptional regulator [Leptospiraceae bacterium]|nr:Crp/Fnr family transcriptional regulator [Leptospiraceae bacterium]